jgi:DHA1 family bicyclomycin/chloramphenicol resistance-like MFS transporter
MYNRYLSVYKKHYPAKKLALVLALIIALSPFAIDTYLPAIPTMAQFFSVDIHLVELSIPLYLIGFAFGQLSGGPISDNYGRKWIGIIGMTVFMCASIAIIFAQSIEQLWLLRFIQAFGGGFGLVICAAIVRDLYDGKDAAKIFTLIGLIMMVAPLIAPSIGSLLLLAFNWQAIFVLLAVYAFIQMIVIVTLVPETKKLRKVAGLEQHSFKQVFINYWHIMTKKSALPFLLSSSFVAATMFAFLTEISFLYIEYFNVLESKFAWLFALNIVSMMVCNRINHYLLDYWHPVKILKMGLILQVTTAALLLLSAVMQLINLPMTVVLLMAVIGSFGLIAPNNMSSFMHYFPKNSGAATAVVGSSQYIFGAIIGVVLSLLHNGTPLPMFAMVFFCALMGFLSVQFRNNIDETFS